MGGGGANPLCCSSDRIRSFLVVWFNANWVIFDVSGSEAEKGLGEREINTVKVIRTRFFEARAGGNTKHGQISLKWRFWLVNRCRLQSPYLKV